MKQILIINGGSSYDSYQSYLNHLKSLEIDYDRLKKSGKWRDWVSDAMSSDDVDVLVPDFPNKQNANFYEWSIYFEKILDLLGDEVYLVGYSLGAMFLAKYLHDKPLNSPVRKLVLIAPCYDDTTNEELGSFGIDSATGLEKSTEEIHLFHSQDDPVSPFSELDKFKRDIPDAKLHIFTDRNHFFQPTFPELLDLLKS